MRSPSVLGDQSQVGRGGNQSPACGQLVAALDSCLASAVADGLWQQPIADLLVAALVTSLTNSAQLFSSHGVDRCAHLHIYLSMVRGCAG